MKKLYTTIIVFGLIIEVAILMFFYNKYIAYGPVIFWAIGLFGILNYGANIFKLSYIVKKTKPELFKRHSFGIMITRSALSDNKFLSKLNEDEHKVIENNKTIFKYILLCFVLFAISIIPIVLKLYI